MLKEYKIIGFAGHMGSGKTTASHLVTGNMEHYCMNFAEEVRIFFSIITRIPVEQTRTVEQKAVLVPQYGKTIGQMLQDIGEGMRRIYPDIWVNMLEDHWNDIGHPPIVIGDVRYPNEVAWIERQGGIVIRLTRDCHDSSIETRDKNHESETALNNHAFSYSISNNETKEQLWDALCMLKEKNPK